MENCPIIYINVFWESDKHNWLEQKPPYILHFITARIETTCLSFSKDGACIQLTGNLDSCVEGL